MALSATLTFFAMFTNAKAGATGLTVTATIKKLTRATSPTISTVTTGGAITVGSVTEVDSTNAKGLYSVTVSGLDPAADYIAAFHTAGTVDQADIPALWSEFSPSIQGGALPQVAAEAAGGLYTRGTGAGQIAQNANGTIAAEIRYYGGFEIGADTVGGSNFKDHFANGGTAATIPLGRLDAAVTTRMATYNQPTGFLSATFPTTVASTTNITSAAGVVLADGSFTTAKFDSKCDFTATQQTSIGNAVGASDTGSYVLSVYQALPTTGFLAGAADIAGVALLGTNAPAGWINNAAFASDVGSTAYASNIVAKAAKIGAENAGLALEATLTTIKGSTFNASTDSLEAIRDRGDSAWITANVSGLLTETAFNTRIPINGDGIPEVSWVDFDQDAAQQLLVRMITLDTGSTYASAVAGSVVKEIVANVGGGSSPTVDQIDTKLSTTHGAGAWGAITSGLSGSTSVTLTVVDYGATPVPNAAITVVGIGTIRANVSGVAAFSLDAGTYSVNVAPTSGVLFSTTSLVVVDGVAKAQTITGTAVTPLAVAADQTAGQIVAFDGQGALDPGTTLQYRLATSISAAAGRTFDRDIRTTPAADANGLIQVALAKSCNYEFRRVNAAGKYGRWVPMATGSGSTSTLTEILARAED